MSRLVQTTRTQSRRSSLRTNDLSRGRDSRAELIVLATEQARAGRLSESLNVLQERLIDEPDDPDLLYARALTFFDWGRLRESLSDLRTAQARGLASFGLHLNLAQASHVLGFAEDAERHAREAIALEDGHANGHLCLAAILQSARRFDEAVRSYERAYQLAPDRSDCLRHIAACKIDQRELAGAEQAVRRAILAEEGEQANSWALLAVTLARQDRYEESLTAFDRAEEIESRTGQQAETFVMHGYNLLGCGRVAEAIALYRRHLPSRPHPSAHAHYGFSLLTAGLYLEGWKQYEFRWLDRRMGAVRPTFSKPRWNGQDLRGKTVLVWAEQGFGDAIQFARFAQALKDKGARIILRVPAKLRELAAGFAGVDHVISAFEENTEPYDYQIAAMSVPNALAMTLGSFPRVPSYLKADADRVARWRERLPSTADMTVGLVWAGNPTHENDRHRSLPAAALAPLWDVEGVRFHSLQKERRPDDDACLPWGTTLLDCAPDLHDFRETAATIECLDLIVTVDTAVAHLAGALGKPCWILLPANADFRWLRDREDSPWYPTMRLFRQRSLGDWDGVIGRVSEALREAARRCKDGEGPSMLTQAAPSPSVPQSTADQEDSAAAQVSQIAETLYGLIQYMPREKRLADSLEWYGEWLQPQLEVLARLLRPGAVVVEAASGIGVHAIALARIIGPNGHLFAYESDATLRRLLDQNLRVNQLRELVTLTRRDLAGLATGEQQGAVPYRPTEAQGETGDACDTVDGLRLERLDLLKINDSEGAEAVLGTATDALWRLRPMLFIAARDETAFSRLVKQVKDFGYRCWRMDAPLFNAGNFNRRDRDIFAGATSLALLAIPEEAAVSIQLDACVELG